MTTSKTKQLIRIALLSGTIVSMYFVPWVLLKAWILPLPATVNEQVQAITDYGFDGVIVYVNQRGGETAHYAAGYKNREEKIPADPDALFKIASIGKLYDAVAITRLVHQGDLSLDENLAGYFPELSGRIANADKISLRMLVQHRSGIPNLTDTPDFWTNPPKNSDEALARVLDLPANFAPDAQYEYSNTNYLLLSLLIEKVTGQDKFQFIKQEVLDPLGLQNTYASIHEVDMDDVMSGYYVGVEEDIKSVDYGSMLATAEDVGIFLRALNEGSLFAAGEQEMYSSLYEYDHTGLIAGYQSIARYHSDIDAVVVQFTNTTDFAGYQWHLSTIFYERIVNILRKN
jgi:CubicO group peptidase (beta-lactamase class C family)